MEPVQTQSPIPPDKAVLFFDGLCGFCDRTVQFVLGRDRRDAFRFAPLQSELAHQILPRHGKNPEDLNTLYLLLDAGKPSERVLEKSDAAVEISKRIGGWTGFWGSLLQFLPRAIRNWGYDRVAANRYRIFGKRDSCRIPQQSEREKFLAH